MINPATWVVSLVGFAVAFTLFLCYFVATQKAEKEARRLRQDIREMEQELEIVRRMAAAGVVPNPPKPQPQPEPKPPTEKQIKQAIRDLKKWVNEDG